METPELNKLKEIIDPNFYVIIIMQARAGDPDWLLDILDGYKSQKPGDMDYHEGFTDKLQEADLDDDHFDMDQLAKEIYSLDKN